MNKAIQYIIFIGFIVSIAYLILMNGLLLYGQSVGMYLVLYHPLLPFTGDFVGVVNIAPQIIEFIFLCGALIFFSILGYKKLKHGKVVL